MSELQSIIEQAWEGRAELKPGSAPAKVGDAVNRVLADLDPAPPYDELARAQGAHAERVEKPADLPDALARARDVVVNERRQALLNVITPY